MHPDKLDPGPALHGRIGDASLPYPGRSRNNLSSGVFGATSGLGEVIGPLFGAAVYEKSGFRMTSDLVAMVTFFYAFVFIFVLTNDMGSTHRRRTALSEEEEQKQD